MVRPGYTVKFTLLDMGDYVGHKKRPWFAEPKSHWKTMFIDVISEDTNKNLNAEFLIDSDGNFQRLLIADEKGNKRIVLLVRPQLSINEKDYEFYYGKGIYPEQVSYVQEIYIDNSLENISQSKNYLLDKKLNKFLDDDGNEPPKSILTNINLGNLFRKAADNITTQFNLKGDIVELEDFEFGDL